VCVQNRPDGVGALCVWEMEELINLNINAKFYALSTTGLIDDFE